MEKWDQLIRHSIWKSLFHQGANESFKKKLSTITLELIGSPSSYISPAINRVVTQSGEESFIQKTKTAFCYNVLLVTSSIQSYSACDSEMCTVKLSKKAWERFLYPRTWNCMTAENKAMLYSLHCYLVLSYNDKLRTYLDRAFRASLLDSANFPGSFDTCEADIKPWNT